MAVTTGSPCRLAPACMRSHRIRRVGASARKCRRESGTRRFTPLLVCLALLEWSCVVQTVHSGPTAGVASLWDGFVYVGEDVDRTSHSNYGQDLPAKFLRGREYVFHHRVPFDDVEFAGKALPSRLKMLGFSITSTVDDGGVIDMDPGGAMWHVKFARPDCSGIIHSRPCASLIERRIFADYRWGESDFVLELEGTCGGIR